MDVETIGLLIRREVRDAVRNRWLAWYAAVFAVLAWSLSWMGLSLIEQHGVSSFGRTSVSMINLVLLVVPLMGVLLGAMSLALEREKGTLAYTLSQPVTAGEVLLGKYLGLSLSMLAALLIGFGLSGLYIAWKTGIDELGAYAGLLGLSFALAMISLGLGLLVSAALKRASLAIGLAVLIWSGLVYFGDLGIMGSAVVLKFSVHQLLAAACANPLQVYKLAAVLVADGSLDVLGPAGQYAVRNLGPRLFPLLLLLLAGWVLLPLLATYVVFRKKGAL